ncbi:MAG: hypothetical protein GY749_37525 [Desulfobacteraceae bacterium]|nr:hypothetical protein [Desulfobacteraceae bacterium]
MYRKKLNHAIIGIAVFGFVMMSVFNSVHAQTWPILLHVTDDEPVNVTVGQTITVTFTLKNDSSIDASGYRLASLSPGVSASYPTFSIPAGKTGSAKVVNFLVTAVPIPRTEFVILDSNGVKLPTLKENLYIGAGGIPLLPSCCITNTCTPDIICPPPCPDPNDPSCVTVCIPVAPSIGPAELWQSGLGEKESAVPSSTVSGNQADPKIRVNSNNYPMSSMDNGDYGSQVDTKPGINNYKITAEGTCGATASFSFKDYNSYLFQLFWN